MIDRHALAGCRVINKCLNDYYILENSPLCTLDHMSTFYNINSSLAFFTCAKLQKDMLMLNIPIVLIQMLQRV